MKSCNLEYKSLQQLGLSLMTFKQKTYQKAFAERFENRKMHM